MKPQGWRVVRNLCLAFAVVLVVGGTIQGMQGRERAASDYSTMLEAFVAGYDRGFQDAFYFFGPYVLAVALLPLAIHAHHKSKGPRPGGPPPAGP